MGPSEEGPRDGAAERAPADEMERASADGSGGVVDGAPGAEALEGADVCRGGSGRWSCRVEVVPWWGEVAREW